MRQHLSAVYGGYLKPGVFSSALAAIWILGAGLILFRDGLTYVPLVLVVGAGALIRGSYWKMRADVLAARSGQPQKKEGP